MRVIDKPSIPVGEKTSERAILLGCFGDSGWGRDCWLSHVPVVPRRVLRRADRVLSKMVMTVVMTVVMASAMTVMGVAAMVVKLQVASSGRSRELGRLGGLMGLSFRPGRWTERDKHPKHTISLDTAPFATVA